MIRDVFSAVPPYMSYIICFSFGYAFGCLLHD